MKFTDVNGECCATAESTDHLNWIAYLLQCNSLELASALTTRPVRTRDDALQMNESTSQAYYERDTFSKVSTSFFESFSNEKYFISLVKEFFQR